MKVINCSATMTVLFSILFVPVLLAQVNWTHVTNQPVIKCGAEGGWDDGCTLMPIVIKEGDTLKMWYTGVDDAVLQGWWRKGYAWSLDGVNWEKHPGNPIKLSIELEIIIKNGNAYEGWGRINDKLYYSTSLNGINWTSPVVTDLQTGNIGDWDEASFIFRAGPVVKDETGYKMWYIGTKEKPQIGLATSTDGLHWIKYDDPATTQPPFAHSDPVLKAGGSSDWDAGSAFDHWVMHSDRGYEMWYSSGFSSKYSIGYATSIDGISWTKWPENPILRTSPAWGMGYVTCCVLEFDDHYHLWYASYKSNDYTEIGYMISEIGTDVETANTTVKKPAGFKLEQNYPNPFNPSTTIEFSIPKSSFVTLKIYNVLGEEIAVVVSKRLSAGSHEFRWDGSRFAGGLYLCRLEVEGFVQTKKLMVMK
jgi:hypothetical protein